MIAHNKNDLFEILMKHTHICKYKSLVIFVKNTIVKDENTKTKNVFFSIEMILKFNIQ